MESRVVFVLILATVAFKPDHVCSYSIHASENPVPEGSNVTLYSTASVATGGWLFNNSFIVLKINETFVIANSWHGKVTFNSTSSSLTIKSLRVEDSGEYNLQTVTDSAQLILSVQVPISNVTLKAEATSLVEFNDTAVLMCSVSSGFSPSYVWMKGDKVLTASGKVELSNGNTTLTIVNVTRHDKGPFKCNVSNSVSHQISPPVYLNISYGPSNPMMMIMPMASHYIYRTGSNITLSCSAMSSPPATIWWMVNGTYLHEYGPCLQLVNITESNSGVYKCVFQNTVTSRFISTSTKLWVLDPLEAVEVNNTGGPVIFNESLTLHCDVIGPVDRIQWWRNEHIISPDDRIVFDMENKTLTLHPVQHSDKGYYQCQAFNAVSNMTSSPYKVEVIYGPETPNITGPTVAKTGYNVTFSCYASSYPPSHYRWFFNHSPVAYTSKYIMTHLTKNMSGMYTCEAYNNVTGNNKTAHTMFNVIDPIEDVRVEAPMEIPKEGYEYMLECNVTGPAKYIYWMKNAVKLQEDSTTVFNMDNKSIIFNPLRRSDDGLYSCKAMNAVGSMVSPSYKLRVNFGPETPDITGPRFAETGRLANFNCSAMSVPQSHYKWRFNGTSVANTSAFTTDLLTLNMSGEYTCMAYNNVTGKNSTNSKMLTVIEAIESVLITSSVPINLKNFTLICDVTGPYDMIYWKKDNLLLNTSNQDTNYRIEKNMLHFTPVGFLNEGAYQCDAINKAGGHESNVYKLWVMYGPLSMEITGPDSEKPGTNVSLKCTADCRNCNFYWYFNDPLVPIIKNGPVFSFSAAKESEGTYICMSVNPVTKLIMYKTKAFTLTDHASAIPFPSRGSLMLIGVFTLFFPVMSN